MFRLVEPFLMVLLVGLFLTAYWDWPGGAQVRRAARWLAAWARRNPASALLWALVLMHGIMLAGLPAEVQDKVLRVHSTNLYSLDKHPISSLITSAFWTELGDLPFVTLMAFFVWGPAERWLGTPRAILVFFTGHIGASLLAATRAAQLFDAGLLHPKFAWIVDVGVSMGSLALAGLLTYRLKGWWRAGAIVGLLVVVPASVVLYGRYSTTGHLAALLIGFLLWPLTRTPEVRARASDAWVKTEG